MLMRRWLDAAEITDPELRRCYLAVAQHWKKQEKSRIYRLWHLTLPARLRPYLHALVTMALLADTCTDTGDPATRQRRFDEFTKAVFAAIAAGHSEDPVLNATAHTFGVWGLRTCLLEEVFEAMRRDIAFVPFATYEELQRWAAAMTGAAQMLLWPLIGYPGTSDRAEPWVRRGGAAAQIADNLFDLAEDLRDGRLYLPLEDLDRFGVKPDGLFQGRWSTAVSDLLVFEAARERVEDQVLDGLYPLMHPGFYPFVRVWAKFCNLMLDAVLRAGAESLRYSPPLRLQEWFSEVISRLAPARLSTQDIPFQPGIPLVSALNQKRTHEEPL